MPETTALGAAMAAGSAEGVGVWSLDPKNLNNITTDTFTPCIREKGKGYILPLIHFYQIEGYV